jgi:hypothetical protein
MPNYDVGNRAATFLWRIQAGPPPPPPPARPRAIINMGASGVAVGMGAMNNIALNGGATGLFTNHLANCSAFAILWRPGGGAFARASLIHMLGGPDPNAVNWAAMLAGMGPGGTYYGVLANSQSTVLSAGFVAAVLANTPIPAANMWVYNAEAPGGVINFGVDWNGFAGEP